MKRIRTRIQKRDREKVAQVAPVATGLESRPFDLEEESSDTDNVPELQAKEELGEGLGHSLGNISISAKETAEDEAEMVQAKDEEESADLVPQEEEATPEVQAKDEEDVQVQSEEEDDLMQQAQELYEKLLAGDEAAIATLQEYGLDPENVQTLAPEEAIATIQAALKTTVSE
jgi:hypothetical protein